MITASLAARLGMNLSPAFWGTRMVVLPVLARSGHSFFDRSFDGLGLTVEPVPVRVQSETPSSSRLGDFADLAIFDLGESRCACCLDAERAK